VLLREPINVILAGKREGRRHFTTSFSENVIVAGTSYQISEVQSLCDRERAKLSSIIITALVFDLKTDRIKRSGLNFF